MSWHIQLCCSSQGQSQVILVITIIMISRLIHQYHLLHLIFFLFLFLISLTHSFTLISAFLFFLTLSILFPFLITLILWVIFNICLWAFGLYSFRVFCLLVKLIIFLFSRSLQLSIQFPLPILSNHTLKKRVHQDHLLI